MCGVYLGVSKLWSRLGPEIKGLGLGLEKICKVSDLNVSFTSLNFTAFRLLF